jgi:Flp pilus assembly pilin Flp
MLANHPLYVLAMANLAALREDEEGQTFIEYTLVLTVIVLAIIALTQFTGLISAIGTALGKVTAKL